MQTQTGRLDRRTVLNRRYQILHTIGRGGMGAVYQARDLKRQTVCAVKEMSLSMVPPEERAQAVQNFKSEAKMLAGLHHPNLPTFSEFFTEGSRHFLVMEFIDGTTLEDYLEQNNAPFPEQRVLAWARQLCDVLTYLHSQHPPIIFRDMKPGNIMLMPNGRIKLIDFGIARFFRHAGSQDTQLLGTPGFAPPEQYGKAQTDERSDIYSLAVTLFQLMTNTLSEQGFGLHNVDLINPDISPSVAQALEMAAALSPDDRFQSAEEFRRALFSKGNAAITIPSHSTGSQNSRVRVTSAQVPARGHPASRQSSPVEMLVLPPAIHFGEVYPGISETAKLSIIGNRSTFISGTITANEPWILVDRSSFDGPSTRVNVQVDTTRLRTSTHYMGSVLVIPDEEDEEQDIVVKVEVDVLDEAQTPGLRPAAAMNGQSRQGKLRLGAALDMEDEENEEDEGDTFTTIANSSASSMVMAPPIRPSTVPSLNKAKANEYRAKYGEPGRKNNPSPGNWDPSQTSPLWVHWSLTVFAAFMAASLCYTVLSEIPLLAHKSLLPPNPAFILVLLGMIPLAALGALVVNLQGSYETVSRLCTGLNMALLAVGTGEFIWQFLLRLNIPPLQLFVLLLLAAIGGTIGTHPTVSEKILEKALPVVEYVRWIAITIALLIGGLLGLALTTGFALSFFTFLGLLVGCGIAMALVLWSERLLQENAP